MRFELDHTNAPIVREAIFSNDRVYRYDLIRAWDSRPQVAFVGLNPSTADETADDATIRRCVGFAQSWGFGGLHMLNLFAYRATNPSTLQAVKNPVGPDNDHYLLRIATDVGQVVICWGNHGDLRSRDVAVLMTLATNKLCSKVYNLGLTKLGQPRHPLRLAKTTNRERQWLEDLL